LIINLNRLLINLIAYEVIRPKNPPLKRKLKVFDFLIE